MRFTYLLLILGLACGGNLDDKIDRVKQAAEDFCACLASSTEQDSCLASADALEHHSACVDSAVAASETGPDVEGFIDCYEGKADAARACIDSAGGCTTTQVASCIEVSGIYNCEAPAMVQSAIDACL